MYITGRLGGQNGNSSSELFRLGESVEAIAAQLQRQPSAIRSRLVKLNVISLEDHPKWDKEAVATGRFKCYEHRNNGPTRIGTSVGTHQVRREVRIQRLRLIRFLPLCILLALLLSRDTAFSRLVPTRNAREGILDAELVVIVSHRSADEFQIDEVFLGDAGAGGSVRLPGFKLLTYQWNGPDLIDPISPNTRILLFLQRKKDDPTSWEPTQRGYCFFWVQEPGRVFGLRSIAQQALTLRQRWEEAARIPDLRKRAEALFPFLRLREYGLSVFEHTKLELQRAGPAAGDYIAERFEEIPRLDRSSLYHEAGAYGSEKLHQTLISHVKNQQQIYEDFVTKYGLQEKSVLENWNTIPDEIKDVYGEVYSGLDGVGSFKDGKDLPFVREVALWAVKFGLEQTCEAALAAFRNMPDKANLPVIDAIWKEFSPSQTEGNQTIRFDVIRSLCAHLFPETIPLLAPFVVDKFAGSEVEDALSDIVGEDLGPRPTPWLAWYAAHKPPE